MSARLRFLLVALIALAWPTLAQGAVRIQFYSHDFDNDYPHAFVVLKGTIDATGQAVDTNIGFTAVKISPAILARSVPGKVEFDRLKAPYIARSNEHFAFTLTDEEYGAVMKVAEAWRARPQPSYNLGNSNCVFFIADIAQALNLRGEVREGLMKRPRSFLEQVTIDSAPVLAGLAARQNRPAAQPPVDMAASAVPPPVPPAPAALAN